MPVPANNSRIVALDFLRGVMLLLMMIDHSFFMGFTQWTAVRDWLYGFIGCGIALWLALYWVQKRNGQKK